MSGSSLNLSYTKEVVGAVQAMIDRGNASGARIEAWDGIIKLLLDKGLAWKGKLLPEHVGVHPQNRSGLGVGGSEAHHHGAQILKGGFSWNKCADVVALEVPPPPFDADAIRANAQYESLSDGFIPPLQALKYLSIGGGHANTFFCAR